MRKVVGRNDPPLKGNKVLLMGYFPPFLGSSKLCMNFNFRIILEVLWAPGTWKERLFSLLVKLSFENEFRKSLLTLSRGLKMRKDSFISGLMLSSKKFWDMK